MPTKNEDAVEVRRVPTKIKGVRVGKPERIVTSTMRSKVAYPGTGGTSSGTGGNFYSPELSTDFLELPQSLDEKRNYFRFFYQTDPFVGQAVDLHTELPLSKIRLSTPKAKDPLLAKRALDFCTNWARTIGLLHRLIEIVHDYNLLGEVFVFCEDNSPDMPDDITNEVIRELDDKGDPTERVVQRTDADVRAEKWLKRNYKGWTALRVLPPEQVHMESFPFTDEKLIELIPDSKTKDVVNRADMGDESSVRIVKSMPEGVVNAIREGTNIPLNTDPDAGSFVYYMSRKKSQYEPRGHSMLERCFLPGTLVTVDRGGVIQQVPVEQVNTTTDLFLTHMGRFQKGVSGSRPVQENITVIHVEGSDQPLALTSDHRVFRVRADGSDEVVLAGDLHEGDTLRESHVVPTGEHPEVIDLAAWWQGRTLTVGRRDRSVKGRVKEDRTVQAVVVSEPVSGGLAVTFDYTGDSLCQTESMAKMGRLLDWLKALSVPTEATYETVCAVTSLSYRDVQNYAHMFRQRLGLHTENRSLGRGKGTATTWFPLPADARLWGDVGTFTLMSDTANIPVDEDFCYLLGTWLGDGYLWTSKDGELNTPILGWSFGAGDPELHAKVLELAHRYFGPSVTDKPLRGEAHPDDQQTLSVTLRDALVARWFRDTFGLDCTTKFIPRWVFDLPEGHILALLRGVLDTDGYVQQGRASSVEVTLDNATLIDQLHLLCSRVGIHTSIRSSVKAAHDWTRRWWTKGKRWVEKTYHYEAKSYAHLHCTQMASVWRWAGMGSLKGAKVAWREPPANAKQLLTGWLNHRVIRVDTVPYDGLVYSFDVEGDESLVVCRLVSHNCLRILTFRDKLRQAQTSIASRHMTPIRVIHAEDMSAADTEALREQVDLALQDPDYSIITNFAVEWNEMGSQGRLLELSSEYEMTDRQMYAGLGVTESLLSGESSYSGDRINLEVINTRYMLLREILQDMVENTMLRPMCRRMGFIETDDDGNETVICPSLSFTRLALRDNADTFDALFNLYQKGSLDVDTILELLNIDPHTTLERLKRDALTFNDSKFNDVLGGLYGEVGRALAESTNATERIAETLGLKYTPKAAEGDGRF